MASRGSGEDPDMEFGDAIADVFVTDVEGGERQEPQQSLPPAPSVAVVTPVGPAASPMTGMQGETTAQPRPRRPDLTTPAGLDATRDAVQLALSRTAGRGSRAQGQGPDPDEATTSASSTMTGSTGTRGQGGRRYLERLQPRWGIGRKLREAFLRRRRACRGNPCLCRASSPQVRTRSMG
jgi:hypothetical protein